jgi:hypothetical protein
MNTAPMCDCIVCDQKLCATQKVVNKLQTTRGHLGPTSVRKRGRVLLLDQQQRELHLASISVDVQVTAKGSARRQIDTSTVTSSAETTVSDCAHSTIEFERHKRGCQSRTPVCAYGIYFRPRARPGLYYALVDSQAMAARVVCIARARSQCCLYGSGQVACNTLTRSRSIGHSGSDGTGSNSSSTRSSSSGSSNSNAKGQEQQGNGEEGREHINPGEEAKRFGDE